MKCLSTGCTLADLQLGEVSMEHGRLGLYILSIGATVGSVGPVMVSPCAVLCPLAPGFPLLPSLSWSSHSSWCLPSPYKCSSHKSRSLKGIFVSVLSLSLLQLRRKVLFVYYVFSYCVMHANIHVSTVESAEFR